MKKEDENNIKTVLGNLLRQERKKAGFTMLEVATYFGHHKSWLGDIETGSNNISATILISLLDYYQTDTVEFTKKAVEQMRHE